MKKLIVILSLLFIFSSCKVSFVPTASVVIKSQVTAAIKTTDSLFVAESVNTDKSFTTYQSVYTSLQNSISSIQSQDSARAKSGLILLQVARLQSAFNQFIATHQSKGVLNNVEIETNHNIIDALWLPILVSENSLK